MGDLTHIEGKRRPVLVIGGGIAGLTAALEAAEAGAPVVLIERSQHLGGRAIAFHLYFPKLCPPSCGFEINFKRLKNNSHITLFTGAELENLSGKLGDYEVTIRLSPRLVSDGCTLCGKCAEVCPAERPDDFNFGLSKTKAIYAPNPIAFPAQYAIDRTACPEGCTACAEACAYGAINLKAQPERQTIKVAAVIAATAGRLTTPSESRIWDSAACPT